jgi:hypothetical protein
VSPCRPSTSERRPLRRTRLLLCALQIATATLVVKSSSTPPLPQSGRHCLYLTVTLLGLPPPSTTSTTITTSTLATSASKGYHLHVVLAGFLLQSQHSRHHDAVTAGDVSSSDSTFDLLSSLTICGAPVVTVEDISIFGRLYILYNKLSYMLRYI